MPPDLKFALRSLLKTPGFTLIAVLTLALGTGATIAIFSMVDAILLRPLPYAQPERLVKLYTELPKFTDLQLGVSKAEYLDIKREVRSWESIEAWTNAGANMSSATTPVRVTASFVTGGMLASLGVAPALGRIITPQDDELGAALVTVISHGLWQRAFGGDRAIVGRDILLNGKKHTVVGVMPEGFSLPPEKGDASEIWAPLQIDPANTGDRSNHILTVVGRLKPGVTLHQAQAELDSLVRYWAKSSSDPNRFDPVFHTIATRALHEEVVSGVRPALRMLFGAVCFLLLIACINVVNLLLARTEARQSEIAIRGAMGANVWRLMMQFVTEGVLLASAGAAIGLLLAQGGLHLIKAMAGADIPRAADLGIDGRVVLFAIAMSLIVGLVAGLAPLVHVLKRNLHDTMKSSAASTTEGAGTQRFRQILIMGQLALALILLTGTGLMLRGFWELQQVKAGFEPQGVVTMSVSLPDTNYSSQAARDFWTRLEERLKAVPDTREVAFTTALPPVQSLTYMGTRIEGFVPTESRPTSAIDFWQVVSQSYFDTLRIPLVQGRWFDERDDANAPPVMIVNQTLARTFFGNEDAVGRRIVPYSSNDWYTVIGVMADVKNGGLGKPTGTGIYLPYKQAASHSEIVKEFFLRSMYIAVRTHGDPGSVVNTVRREVNRIDPTLPLASVRTMQEVVAQSQSRPQFLTLVLTLFAGIALVLAAVGIYGVVSYSVAQRTREFGLRMALGAQPENVLRLVMRRGLLLILCGVAIGVVGSFASTRLLSGFLFGVTATDPATFVIVALLLCAIAAFASYIPARRATKVDPLVALRAE